MSLMLAPYNSAMRIGAGFNSYTQQICVNQAVVPDAQNPGGDVELSQPVDASEATHVNRGVSQIVTYSSRFVEKLSDITDSMNISGSLSIKANGIGGSGGGSFVDTNKFKDSDLNFFIQVKVINQRVVPRDNLKFQPLKNVKDFTSVFGDCFISGFLEGGEFNALVTIKIKNKEKLNEIKANLEVNLTAGSIGVQAKADVNLLKSDLDKNTETSISVAWAGGGQDLKVDKNSEWTIDSLTLAATAFADKVAACPQRTNAILTKYTNLRSFQEQPERPTPLDYENAGIYTAALLDAYMDYKNMWKDVQLLQFEVASRGRKLKETVLDDKVLAEMQGAAEGLTPPRQLKPMGATLFALDNARSSMRAEMVSIITEVDVVTNDPRVALDAKRKVYLSPIAFRQLLPTLEPPPPPPPVATPEKTLTQGQSTEQAGEKRAGLFDRPPEVDAATKASLQKYDSFSAKFCLSTLCGTPAIAGSTFVHPFESYGDNSANFPTKIALYPGGIDYFGWVITHSNGLQVAGKTAECGPQTVQEFVLSEGERIVCVGVESPYRGSWGLDCCPMSFTVATNRGRMWSVSSSDTATIATLRKQKTQLIWNGAPAGYSFRSFYGYHKERISAIGVVWGKD